MIGDLITLFFLTVLILPVTSLIAEYFSTKFNNWRNK